MLLCYYYFIVCSISCWTSLSLLKIEHANTYICTFNLAKHVFRWIISIIRYWVVQCITRTYLHYIKNLYTYWNIGRSDTDTDIDADVDIDILHIWSLALGIHDSISSMSSII